MLASYGKRVARACIVGGSACKLSAGGSGSEALWASGVSRESQPIEGGTCPCSRERSSEPRCSIEVPRPCVQNHDSEAASETRQVSRGEEGDGAAVTRERRSRTFLQSLP